MILQTQRLILRKLTLDDAQFIIELTNSVGWLRFIGDRNTKTIETAQAYIERTALKNYELYGSGLYLVKLRDNQTPIGICGIMHRQNLPNPDIAFAFLAHYEGFGYAFEIASSVVDYARNVLKINALSAIVVPENTRSVNLIEKLNMSFVKKFRFEGDSEDMFLYEINLIDISE
jgi:RimJ/RimL family protein N-acetyltransferase